MQDKLSITFTSRTSRYITVVYMSNGVFVKGYYDGHIKVWKDDIHNLP